MARIAVIGPAIIRLAIIIIARRHAGTPVFGPIDGIARRRTNTRADQRATQPVIASRNHIARHAAGQPGELSKALCAPFWNCSLLLAVSTPLCLVCVLAHVYRRLVMSEFL